MQNATNLFAADRALTARRVSVFGIGRTESHEDISQIVVPYETLGEFRHVKKLEEADY